MSYAHGRCNTCRVLHIWPERAPLVRDAKCPTCGTQLARTTHRLTWPVQRWEIALGRGPYVAPPAAKPEAAS